MELSYRRHRFPPAVIQHTVWLYLRFTLSYRDAENALMPNHVHLIVRPSDEDGLRATFAEAHRRYTGAFNTRMLAANPPRIWGMSV